jgi:hypothetical protein
MTEQTIPWGDDEGLGETWWRENGKVVGATEQQIIFSASYHAGATATAAAKAAKYSGNADTLRQAGHRAHHSTAVQSLLNLAYAATGTGPSGNVDLNEAKSILSRLARQSDPSTRIRSLELLVRINEREQEREREHGADTDVHAEIAEIRKISPELADAYADSKGLNRKSSDE